METYKKLLPKRIPEYLQGDNELQEYLETAGELFDEFAAAIEDMDNLHDYARVPEQHLAHLASQFAMEFPRNLNPELQRTIIRDLEAIYKKSGTVDVVNWVFRLIGWDVKVEYAWLPNPEKYDPEIGKVFSLDDYDQQQMETVITDFFRTDFRSFLIGDSYVDTAGNTYFKGRKFFDTSDTLPQLEIVGEKYDETTKVRTPDKVMSTPYIFIRVSEETYNIFMEPYVDEDTGEVYAYTDLEFYKVVENIFNFFLFNAFRPTNVRVVVIVTPHTIYDRSVIKEDYRDFYIAKPLEMEDEGVLIHQDFDRMPYELQVSKDFLAGTPPSPFSKDMVISPVQKVDYRNSDGVDEYSNQDASNGFRFDNPNAYPVPRVGTEEFVFVTPHEESFSYSLVYYGGVVESVLSGTTPPYPNDEPALSLCFDLTTDSYGIIETLASLDGFLIRNPTEIHSHNFRPDTVSNEYMVGVPQGSGFEDNTLVDFNFVTGDLKADSSPKQFTYSFEVTIFGKEDNPDPNWKSTTFTPDNTSLANITEYNNIWFSLDRPIGFDFVFDIKYKAQPHWDNRG